MSSRGSNSLKWLDFWIGVPFLRLTSMLIRKRPVPKSIRTIGILKEAAIGDTILLSGPMRDLRAALPDARIIVFTDQSNFGAAKLLPCVDEVVPIQISKPLSALRTIRKWDLDVFLDFGPWPRINAVIAVFSRNQFLAGFNTPKQYRHYAYDLAVPHRGDRHEIDNYRAIVQELGIPTGNAPEIKAEPVNCPIKEPFVVFHPWPSGTMCHLREWAEDRWIELAVKVQSKGHTVLITGSKTDRGRTEALIAKLPGNVVNYAGTGGLGELKDLLAASRAVVSVNTGVMHLAAAVGAPTIGLNGPTSEIRWAPLGINSSSVSVPPPFGGYLNLGFEYQGNYQASMSLITVRQVWEQLERHLDHRPNDKA